MSLSETDRKLVVAYRLEKAHRTYDQVLANLSFGFWELIANRLYYSAYYAVSALLIAHGHFAKTHDTIIRVFGQNFVKTGRITKDLGRLYTKLYTLRIKGDYEDKFNPDRSLDQYKGYQRLSSLFIAVIKPSVLASFRFLLSYNARIAPSFKAKRLLKT